LLQGCKDLFSLELEAEEYFSDPAVLKFLVLNLIINSLITLLKRSS